MCDFVFGRVGVRVEDQVQSADADSVSESDDDALTLAERDDTAVDESEIVRVPVTYSEGDPVSVGEVDGALRVGVFVRFPVTDGVTLAS